MDVDTGLSIDMLDADRLRDHPAGAMRETRMTKDTMKAVRSMLAYKCRAGGRRFVEVPSRNSTRTCSACGALTGPTGFAGLKVRQWTCGVCGTHHERDVNAAQNTLLAGLGTSHERGRETASGIVT